MHKCGLPKNDPGNCVAVTKTVPCGTRPCYAEGASCATIEALLTLPVSLLQHYVLALRSKADAAGHQASNQKLLVRPGSASQHT